MTEPLAFRVPARGDTVFCQGHVIAPYARCEGNVEIWDQTLGCPECHRNLWDGKTSDDDFFVMHPLTFEDAHDDGDEDRGAWSAEAINPSMPLGGWRLPSYPPFWHCTDTCRGCVWCVYRRAGEVPGRR